MLLMLSLETLQESTTGHIAEVKESNGATITFVGSLAILVAAFAMTIFSWRISLDKNK